ncbi:hypothetical protein [Gemmatimonas sp.]|uniref:hypothetical protein n=1 Tax=Gemmatimonas sp. TaxID=1962908 RepID=UPI0035652908
MLLSNMSIALGSTDQFNHPPGGHIETTLQAYSLGFNVNRNVGLFTGVSGDRASALANVLEVDYQNPIQVYLSGQGSYFMTGWPPGDPTGSFTIESASLVAFPG